MVTLTEIEKLIEMEKLALVGGCWSKTNQELIIDLVKENFGHIGREIKIHIPYDTKDFDMIFRYVLEKSEIPKKD